MNKLNEILDSLVTATHNRFVKGDSFDRTLSDIDEAKQAIQELIDKAVREVLDRLEPLTHEGRGTIAWEMDNMYEAIQAERKRLQDKGETK